MSQGLNQDYDDDLHLQGDDRLNLRERSSCSPVPLLQRLHHRDLSALLVNCELVLVVSLNIQHCQLTAYRSHENKSFVQKDDQSALSLGQTWFLGGEGPLRQ